MIPALVDTDILSTFGKVNRVDLLGQLFRPIYAAPAVYHELQLAERLAFPWVSTVKSMIEMLSFTKEHSERIARLARTYPQLGMGEIETLALSQAHQIICLTNDRQAKKVFRSLSCSFLNLEDLLRAFKITGLLSLPDLEHLIEEIERKDRTLIKAKHHILKT